MASLPDAASEAPDYSLLDRAGAAQQMFYPRYEDWPPPEGASTHRIEVTPGVEVATRLYGFDAAWPSILFFHGNGEIASDYDDISSFYQDSGLNLFVADFRGYGTSGGQPSAAALVADAHPVADAFHAILDERGFDAARFIMGRSLGAHPALELAADRPEGFGGLVIESGAGGIRRMLGRYGLLDTELGGHLAQAHEAKLRRIRLPVLLIHGAEDELVSLASAYELHDLMPEAQRTIEVIPGAGHNDLMWVGRQRYFSALEEFTAARQA